MPLSSLSSNSSLFSVADFESAATTLSEGECLIVDSENRLRPVVPSSGVFGGHSIEIVATNRHTLDILEQAIARERSSEVAEDALHSVRSGIQREGLNRDRLNTIFEVLNSSDEGSVIIEDSSSEENEPIDPVNNRLQDTLMGENPISRINHQPAPNNDSWATSQPAPANEIQRMFEVLNRRQNPDNR